MGLLKFIDKKITFGRQRSYLNSFMFFGMPIGYLIGQGLSIWAKGWDKYDFKIENLITSLITDLLIASPLIINYIRQTKKYNLIVKKFHDKTLSYKVKAKMNYKEFIQGQVYEIQIFDARFTRISAWYHITYWFNKKYDIMIINRWYHITYWFNKKYDIMIINSNQWRSTNNFYDIINKFELVDKLKEERKKKLKRLQKIMK